MVLGKFAQGATVIPRATQLRLTVQLALESVSSLPWNHCPASRGISVQVGLEYARVRWWDESATTYPTAAILPEAARKALPDVAIPEQARIPVGQDKPVFFGHYWMTGTPTPLSPTAACVDYSVGKGGALVAYRWEGESQLDAAHFASVG